MTTKETEAFALGLFILGITVVGIDRYHLKVIHLAHATPAALGLQTAAGRAKHAGGWVV